MSLPRPELQGREVSQGVRMRSIGWRNRMLFCATVLPFCIAGPAVWAQNLIAEQVVQHLVARNRERAQSLQHYTGIRTYRLEYRGFPGSSEASMEVEVDFDAPSSKHFTIVRASGSKVIQNRVFQRLLEGEEDAGRSPGGDISLSNCSFALEGYDGAQYVLQIEPKPQSKFPYRGKIWVDAKDFAVTRIDAQPARNPSFWTTKSVIHHTYQKLDNGLYLPKENQTVTSVRLGGTATLTIEYQSYRVTAGAKNKPVGVLWPDTEITEPAADFVSLGK